MTTVEKQFSTLTDALYGVCELSGRFATEFTGIRTRRPWWAMYVDNSGSYIRIRSLIYGIEFFENESGWMVWMTIQPDTYGYPEMVAKAIISGWSFDDMAVINRHIVRACGLLLEESGLL